MDDLATSFEAIWFCERLRSTEHFRYTSDGRTHRLSGVVILPQGDRPVTIAYQVTADAAWRSRAAAVTIGEEPALALEVGPDDRTWIVDGHPAPRLDGCVDIDLGWTPATNTLPINRLRLASDSTATVQAAWLRFPEIDLVAAEQTYEMLDENRWVYRNGSFSAELVTNDHGFVTRYGSDLWEMVASR